jgi:hypothetical protein
VLIFPRLPESLETGLPKLEAGSQRDAAYLSKLDEERKRRELSFKANAAVNPAQFRADEAANEDLWQRIVDQMQRPTALFGRLAVQQASADTKDASGAKILCRLFFSLGQFQGIALTDWMEDRAPKDFGSCPLLHEARILGALVGWFKRSTRVAARPEG